MTTLRRASMAVSLIVVALVAFVGARALLVVPENARTIRRICDADRRQDAKQLALWENLLTLPPSQFETADQRAEREKRTPEFRRFIAETFAPTKCQE